MPNRPDPSICDLVFASLERIALAGQRCPMNDDIRGGSATMMALARDGRILIEVAGKNFRQITILTGPHAGLKTMPPPATAGGVCKPFLTIGREKLRAAPSTRQPARKKVHP
jgi:hypothetical protein